MSIDDIKSPASPSLPPTSKSVTSTTAEVVPPNLPSPPVTNPKPVAKLDFRLISNQVYALISDSANPLAAPVLAALTTIEKAIDLYGPSLSLSFNGGKDCTVLMHLYAAALYRHLSLEQKTEDPVIPFIKTVYVTYPEPFQAVEDFVQDSAVRYGLDIVRLPGPMKAGLQAYLDLIVAKGEKIEAILVGQRRSDPYSEHLCHFHPTDPTWPHFMRVHPIIDWTYHEIWHFLLEPSLTCHTAVTGIPYCVLYDWGYTSLGSSHNTFPNPDLLCEGEENKFEPAWRLVNEESERSGRGASPLPQQKVEMEENMVNGMKERKKINGEAML